MSIVWFMIRSAAIRCSAFMRRYSALKNTISMTADRVAMALTNIPGTETLDNMSTNGRLLQILSY